MKCNACGLEVFLELSSKELTKLERNSLKGTMTYFEFQKNYKKEIEIELRYKHLQQNILCVEIIPKETYLGDAKKITFHINKEFYEGLKDKKFFGDRYLDSGKFIVGIDGKKDYF